MEYLDRILRKKNEKENSMGYKAAKKAMKEFREAALKSLRDADI